MPPTANRLTLSRKSRRSMKPCTYRSNSLKISGCRSFACSRGPLDSSAIEFLPWAKLDKPFSAGRALGRDALLERRFGIDDLLRPRVAVQQRMRHVSRFDPRDLTFEHRLRMPHQVDVGHLLGLEPPEHPMRVLDYRLVTRIVKERDAAVRRRASEHRHHVAPAAVFDRGYPRRRSLRMSGAVDRAKRHAAERHRVAVLEHPVDLDRFP